MPKLLPIIDSLAAARDDADRAEWMLKCPLSILISYQTTIRNRLLCAGHADAVAYLDAELTLARAVRDGEGNPPVHLSRLVAATRYRLAVSLPCPHARGAPDGSAERSAGRRSAPAGATPEGGADHG